MSNVILTDGRIELQKAVESWESLLGGSNLVWLPRLTSGIYAVTRILGAKKVIVPNNCCLAIVYGILLGGAEPIFCEVSVVTGALDQDACDELLRQTGAEIVVHVHSFGLYADRNPIHSLCRKHGSFFFEDGAGWFPPLHTYEVLEGGCLGLSFGQNKIFDLGGGATLSFFDSVLAHEVQRVLRSLPPAQDATAAYARDYQTLVAQDGLPIGLDTDFSVFAEKYRTYWIGDSTKFALAPSEDTVLLERRRRRDLARALIELFSHYDVECLTETPLSFMWRFSFLCKDAAFMNKLITSSGLFVSRWYPPLNRFFPKFGRSVNLANSYRLGAEIYNIAFMDDLSVKRIARIPYAYRSYCWKRYIIDSIRIVTNG